MTEKNIKVGENYRNTYHKGTLYMGIQSTENRVKGMLCLSGECKGNLCATSEKNPSFWAAFRKI